MGAIIIHLQGIRIRRPIPGDHGIYFGSWEDGSSPRLGWPTGLAPRPLDMIWPGT